MTNFKGWEEVKGPGQRVSGAEGFKDRKGTSEHPEKGA